MNTFALDQLLKLGAECGGWSTGVNLVTGSKNPRRSQARFPIAAVYTVQLAIDAASAAVPFRAEMVVNFKVAGNSVRRRASVRNGMSISGPAEAIEVELFDTSFVTGSPPPFPPGEEYGVIIQYAIEPHGGPNQPQLDVFDPATGLAWTIGGGGSVNIPIPLDAGVTRVFVQSSESLQVTQTVGAAVLARSGPSVATAPPAGAAAANVDLPIVNGATNLILTNNQAAIAIAAVSFGIDG